MAHHSTSAKIQQWYVLVMLAFFSSLSLATDGG